MGTAVGDIKEENPKLNNTYENLSQAMRMSQRASQKTTHCSIS